MLLIILICIGVVLIYYGLLKPHNYWKEQGAVYEKPWPFFGSLVSTIFQRESIADFVQNIYNRHCKERYALLYQFLTPTIMLRDLDLIKQILVKDFDSFPEHTMIASEDYDPIWANNLFSMRGGEKWREIRSVLSPTFTANKLKIMFELVIDCAERFARHFSHEGDFNELDTNDAFRRVTTDIIATTAFGITCDSWKDRKNEFFLMGTDASDFSGIKMLKFFIASISPILIKLLGVRLIDEKTSAFFRNIIKETISVREKNGTMRPDMLHLMLEARKGRLKNEENEIYKSFAEVSEADVVRCSKPGTTPITEDIIIAQAVVFFLAGFDSTSRAMSFTAYELAINPEVQKRLRVEILETLDECDGKMTYDALLGMKYLDMVVSESLRKWPPFAVTDRRPIRPFVIEGQGMTEKHLKIDYRVVVQIPIYAIHRDPEYYPEPLNFNPERFSDENKHKIKPFSYLPFGGGPRNCIGSRFALLQIKIVLVQILKKFELVPTKKTQIPLILGKSSINPFPEEGFWLGLRHIK